MTLDKRHSVGDGWCYFGVHSGSPLTIRFLILVVQRLDLLLLLAFANLIRVRDPEELWRDFYKPLWLDCCHSVAVFASGKKQLVINHPLGVTVE